MKKFFFLLLFLFSWQKASAQSLSIFDINATNYPWMRAKLLAIDADKIQVKDLSASSVKLKENGIIREVLSINCPDEQEPMPLSLTISMDLSGSMNNYEGALSYLDLAKAASSNLINALNWKKNEISIQSCNEFAQVDLNFSNNKNKALATIEGLKADGNNSFAEQLLNSEQGAFHQAKFGIYKRIVLLFTDGWDSALSPEDLQACVDSCSANNVIFYVVLCSSISPMDIGITSSLKRLAESTGGRVFDGIVNLESTKRIADYLSAEFGQTKPCVIEWKSELFCEPQAVNVSAQWEDQVSNAVYDSPVNSIAKLDFYPPYVEFTQKPIGLRSDTLITVTAGPAQVEVTDIYCTNPNFMVSPSSFTLQAGESTTIMLSVTPPEKDRYFNTLIFKINDCEIEYYSMCFYKGNLQLTKTLRLLSPNGGEKYISGSDTLIKWTGALPGDNAILEFSADGGKKWKPLTAKATGLRYAWKDMPTQSSDSCLIRITTGAGIEPKTEWIKYFKGNSDDRFRSIMQTKYGYYIAIGESRSVDGDFSANLGLEDSWVFYFDFEGQLLWKKNLGGSASDVGISVAETSDGNIVIGGVSRSVDGDLAPNGCKMSDYWLVSLTNKGKLNWSKTYGGSDDDILTSIDRTEDGGIICAGSTASSDGDVKRNNGKSDVWIVKVDSKGKIVWQSVYGGSGADIANSVQETSDGGFIVAGNSESQDGDVSGNYGGADCWLVKITRDGSIEWEKNFGGSRDDYAKSVRETSDGGFVFVGSTLSSDRDVWKNRGGRDVWAVKIDKDGNVQWKNSIGGSDDEEARAVAECWEKGYIVVGSTRSNDGDINKPETISGLDKFWIAKLNQNGVPEWQKLIDSTYQGWANSVYPTVEGGYVICGDVLGKSSEDQNAVIVKIATNSAPQTDISDSLFSIVVPSVASKEVNLGEVLLGNHKDTVVTSFLENLSDYECKIKKIQILNGNAPDFTILSNKSFTLKPRERKAIEFRFRPGAAGLRKAEVSVESQISTLNYAITGIGVEPIIERTIGIIDFGNVETGGAKDTTLAIVKNICSSAVPIESAKLIGPGADQFEILSGFPVPLGSGDSLFAGVRYKPTRCGRVNAELSSYFKGAGSPVTIKLVGRGICGEVRCEEDSAFSGDNFNIDVYLEGVSQNSLKALTDSFRVRIKYLKGPLAVADKSLIIGETADSTIIEFAGPIGKDSVLASIGFIAKSGNKTFTTLDLIDFTLPDGKGGSIPYEAQKIAGSFKLLSKPSGVYFTSDSAYPGERITIELKADEASLSSLKKFASGFRATARFGNTMLAAVDKSLIKNVKGDSTFLEIKGTIGEKPALYSIEFIAGLGATEFTTIDLTEFKWVDVNGRELDYETSTGSGYVKLLGICREGGPRLFNPTSKADILRLSPTPANDKLTATVNMIEKGESYLIIYNSLGAEIARTRLNDETPGVKDVRIDLTPFEPGVYYLKYLTPTTVSGRMFAVE